MFLRHTQRERERERERDAYAKCVYAPRRILGAVVSGVRATGAAALNLKIAALDLHTRVRFDNGKSCARAQIFAAVN